MTRSQIFVLTIVTESGLLLAAFVLGWWMDIPFWSRMQPHIAGILWGIAAGTLMAVFAIVSLELPWKILDQLKRDARQVIKVLGNPGLLIIIFISIAAGVCEEALFRGVMLPWLSGELGIVPALLITSLLFGLAHYVSASYVIYVTLFGIIFGSLYLLFDNLTAPIVAHIVYDFIVLTWTMHIRKIRYDEQTQENI